MGMGGLSTSLRDNSSIYFTNPASYSSLDTNSFVFDFGIDYSINKLSDGEANYKSDDLNFDHLLFGFPLARGLGFAAGIIPLSNGYYRMSEEVLEGDPDYNPVTGEYGITHMGEGGFTNYFMGAGINISKNFAAGINMTILSGQVTRKNQFTFGDYYNVFHNSSSEKLQISGINFDFGLQYTATINKEYFLNAGFSLTPGKLFKTNYENFSYLFSGYSTLDTLSYFSDKSHNTSLPVSYRAGVSFGKKNKFVAGADFAASKWSDAKIYGAEGYLADTKSLIIGAEFIPDKYSNFSMLSRMEYRVGFHIQDNYLIINGDQVKEIGMSAGLGFPMRRTLSKTNLFVDYTMKSGSGTGISHKENYFTVGISLNLYDYWFIKRKYD